MTQDKADFEKAWSDHAEESKREIFIRIDERIRCAERAVAFVDNNYNAFGEWDRVAFDDLRAAIKGAEAMTEETKKALR